MSGASFPSCRVCGESIQIDREYMDGHALMEEHYSCDHCHLYSYSCVTGNSEYRVGFRSWVWGWPLQDHWYQKIGRDEQYQTEKETRTLWQTPEFAQWKWLLPFPVHTRPVDYGVLADWLEERGFPENVRGLRESLAGV